MQEYTFQKCTLAILDREFGLRETFTSNVLDEWLQSDAPLAEVDEIILKTYQEHLVVHVRTWNEQELSQRFIGPILGLVDFTELYRFRLFSEYKISTTVPGIQGNIKLGGEPDGMIATGFREPEVPMFAFTEYKRALDPSGDPVAQTLAALLVGQTLNSNEHPLYGAYVVGGEWYFMVLEGKEYTISKSFSALDDDLFDIFRILRALKQIIIDLTNG